MILHEYIESLQKIIKDNPEAGLYKVIYAIDDEGNAYHEVHNDPTRGNYDDTDYYGEWVPDSQIKEHAEYMEASVEEFPLNSICVN